MVDEFGIIEEDEDVEKAPLYEATVPLTPVDPFPPVELPEPFIKEVDILPAILNQSLVFTPEEAITLRDQVVGFSSTATLDNPKYIEGAEKQLKLDAYLRNLEGAPILTGEIQKDPWLSGIIQNKVPELNWIEQKLRYLKTGFGRGISGSRSSLASYEEAQEKLTGKKHSLDLEIVRAAENIEQDRLSVDEGFGWVNGTVDLVGYTIGNLGGVFATGDISEDDYLPERIIKFSYRSNYGELYQELVDVGVSVDIAASHAHTAGLFAAAIEYAGTAIDIGTFGIGKLFTSAGKAGAKRAILAGIKKSTIEGLKRASPRLVNGVNRVLQSKIVQSATANALTRTSTAAVTNALEEAAQELTLVIVGAFAREAERQQGGDIPESKASEIADRLIEAFKVGLVGGATVYGTAQGIKAAVHIAAGGLTPLDRRVDDKQAGKIIEIVKILDEVQKQFEDIKKETGKAADEITAKMLKENEIEEVYISKDDLQSFGADENIDFFGFLGVEDQKENSRNDVVITTDVFVRNILSNVKIWKKLKDSIKYGDSIYTPKRAEEVLRDNKQEDVEDVDEIEDEESDEDKPSIKEFIEQQKNKEKINKPEKPVLGKTKPDRTLKNISEPVSDNTSESESLPENESIREPVAKFEDPDADQPTREQLLSEDTIINYFKDLGLSIDFLGAREILKKHQDRRFVQFLEEGLSVIEAAKKAGNASVTVPDPTNLDPLNPDPDFLSSTFAKQEDLKKETNRLNDQVRNTDLYKRGLIKHLKSGRSLRQFANTFFMSKNYYGEPIFTSKNLNAFFTRKGRKAIKAILDHFMKVFDGKNNYLKYKPTISFNINLNNSWTGRFTRPSGVLSAMQIGRGGLISVDIYWTNTSSLINREAYEGAGHDRSMLLGVLYHEYIHYLSTIGFFTDEQRRTLVDAADKFGWIEKFSHTKTGKKAYEEGIAQAVAVWNMGFFDQVIPKDIEVRDTFKLDSIEQLNVLGKAVAEGNKLFQKEDIILLLENIRLGIVGRQKPDKAVNPSALPSFDTPHHFQKIDEFTRYINPRETDPSFTKPSPQDRDSFERENLTNKNTTLKEMTDKNNETADDSDNYISSDSFRYNYLSQEPVEFSSPEENIETQIDEQVREIRVLGRRLMFKNAKQAGLTPTELIKVLGKMKDRLMNKVDGARGRLLARLAQIRNDHRDAKESLHKIADENLEAKVGYQILKALEESDARFNPSELDVIIDRLIARPEFSFFIQDIKDKTDVKKIRKKVKNSLPRLKAGRRIYETGKAKDIAKKSNDLISLETTAELHGFEATENKLAAEDLILELLQTVSNKEALSLEVDRLWQQTREYDESLKLKEELDALKAVTGEEIIKFELGRLKALSKDDKINIKDLEKRAKKAMDDERIGDLKPYYFTAKAREHGREAYRAFRNGDLNGTLEHKAKEYYYITQGSYVVEIRTQMLKRLEKVRKYRTKKASKVEGVAINYFKAIVTFLYRAGMRKNLDPDQYINLTDFQTYLNEQEASTLVLPTLDLHPSGLTVGAWFEALDVVDQLIKLGKKRQEVINWSTGEGVDIRAEIIPNMIEAVKNNLKTILDNVGKTFKGNVLSRVDQGHEVIQSPEALFRMVDGHVEGRGWFQEHIYGRYIRGMVNGYFPKMRGFITALSDDSKKLSEIYDKHLTKEQQANFNKLIEVPGVSMPMTHSRLLATMLNMGTKRGRKALVAFDSEEKGQFTADELGAIVQYASKKDWDFVQDIWNFWDSYWDDIKITVERRQGRTPKKEEAAEIITPHGTYAGGYHPLTYTRIAVDDKLTPEEIDQDLTKMRMGGFVAGHTQEGYTKTRTGSEGRKVELDLHIIHYHLERMLYDLEMGDSVRDIRKILTNKELIKTFEDKGRTGLLEAFDRWHKDITTGELRPDGLVQSIARTIKTGWTVSKLGFNARVILLQPFGITSAIGILGSAAVMKGVLKVITGPHMGENSVLRFPSSISPYMKIATTNTNIEIAEATSRLRTRLLDSKLTNLQKITEISFLGISKAQHLANSIVWYAAIERAKRSPFANNRDKVIQYADDVVRRSQGSAIFGTRSPTERGTLGKRSGQSEIVKLFNPFINYFITKNSIIYEEIRKAKRTVSDRRASEDSKQAFKNLGTLISVLTTAIAMYLPEMVVFALFEEWRDDDDYEDDKTSILDRSLVGATRTFISGVPFIRSIASELEGFRGGGILTAIYGDFANMIKQVGQKEFDLALAKSLIRGLGILLHLPGAESARRAVDVLFDDEETNDTWLNLLFGKPYRNRGE